MGKIDLSEIKSWTPEEQQEIRELIIEYGSLFALTDMDLGRTDKVKHSIKLDDYTPFKERYRCIPPHQYEEVRQHLKEMLEIGAISESKSPWASAVVLLRKKDGSLRFCIDLRKLNSRTVNDAYSLPRSNKTLDCLNGSQWFTSLDLKSGYWQVELNEDSKALTAFTVGPLGFYQCERIPFGLTNVPATFQRLMESCLGDMHLKWVIIYLYNCMDSTVTKFSPHYLMFGREPNLPIILEFGVRQLCEKAPKEIGMGFQKSSKSKS